MSSKVDLSNCVKGTGTNPPVSFAHSRPYVRCSRSKTVIKLLHQPNESLMSLTLCSLNIGSLQGRSGEIVEFFERRCTDICCIQETKWRGKSVRMIEGKSMR